MFTGSDSKSSVYRHRCSQEADGAEPPESEPLDGRGEIPVRNLPRNCTPRPRILRRNAHERRCRYCRRSFPLRFCDWAADRSEADVFRDPPGCSAKKSTPEMRQIAKQTRVAVNGQRKWQEPNLPVGPADRGRPIGPENPKRSNRSQPGRACTQAFA